MAGSGRHPEVLDLGGLPLASPDAAEALERNRPGPMDLRAYGRSLESFRWSIERLRALPLSVGDERFTLP